MSQPATAFPIPEAPPPKDDVILLPNVSWADYQRLLEVRGQRSVPRLTYLEGVLELMSPSKRHEAIKSMIGCLVEAWCFEKGIGITPYGSWTHENKDAGRGVEPDECYVLGDAREPERCDLAIEVVWTSGGIDKLDVYRRLGVREVWIWKAGTIDVFSLHGTSYLQIDASELLPGIDLVELLRFVDVRPMTRAATEYRAALRARG